MRKKRDFIYWFPRIFGIIFALFLLLFSFDVFQGGNLFKEILGFIIHSLPSIVLLIVILIYWKYEIVGFIAFSLFALIYIILMVFRAPNILAGFAWSLIVAIPCLLTGIFFLINWRRK